MKKMYFLCTGNSCRSQMAEGFAQKYLADGYEIRSAGVEQHGLNVTAVQVMAEVGIDISDHSSDLIVTLCGAARDKCSVILKMTTHQHWELEDPAGKYLFFFRQVRDEIENRVKQLDTL